MEHLGINIFFDGINFQRILGGLYVSAEIAFLAILIGGVFGVLLGVLRTFQNPVLRSILRMYLEIFRFVPTVVLLFLFYYILPQSFNINLGANTVGILVFSLWMAAEMSDIVRGALISVPQHQIDAGKAIGLTRMQLYQYILLPQSIHLMIPASINLMTRIIKTTSLLLLISVMDVINVGQQVIEANSQHYQDGALWIYGFIFILYFILCYPLSWWAKRLERRGKEKTND